MTRVEALTAPIPSTHLHGIRTHDVPCDRWPGARAGLLQTSHLFLGGGCFLGEGCGGSEATVGSRTRAASAHLFLSGR